MTAAAASLGQPAAEFRTLPRVLARTGVDLFLHDRLRTVENERFEYDTALSCIRGMELIVTCDDLHITNVLAELCVARGVELAHLRERPARQWWPGNDVGLTRFPR